MCTRVCCARANHWGQRRPTMLWGSFVSRAVVHRAQIHFTKEITYKSTLLVSTTPFRKCYFQTGSSRVRRHFPCSRVCSVHRWRFFSANRGSFKHGKANTAQSNRTTVVYIISLAVAVVGFSYAAVPLYRLYCQVRRELGGRGSAVSYT